MPGNKVRVRIKVTPKPGGFVNVTPTPSPGANPWWKSWIKVLGLGFGVYVVFWILLTAINSPAENYQSGLATTVLLPQGTANPVPSPTNVSKLNPFLVYTDYDVKCLGVASECSSNTGPDGVQSWSYTPPADETVRLVLSPQPMPAYGGDNGCSSDVHIYIATGPNFSLLIDVVGDNFGADYQLSLARGENYSFITDTSTCTGGSYIFMVEPVGGYFTLPTPKD